MYLRTVKFMWSVIECVWWGRYVKDVRVCCYTHCTKKNLHYIYSLFTYTCIYIYCEWYHLCPARKKAFGNTRENLHPSIHPYPSSSSTSYPHILFISLGHIQVTMCASVIVLRARRWKHKHNKIKIKKTLYVHMLCTYM